MYLVVFPFQLVGTQTICSPLRSNNNSTCSFPIALSWVLVVSSYACDDPEAEEPSTALGLSLYAVISSLVLCLVNSSHLGLLELWTLGFLTQGAHWALFGSPCPLCCILEVLSKQKQGWLKGLLGLFPFMLRSLSWTSYCLIYFAWFL